MFLPNTYGMLSRKMGTDIYAEQTYAAAVRTPCGVIHLQSIDAKTPIRSDTSATRGNAEEQTEMGKILFPATVIIGLGDKFAIAGLSFEVQRVEPRFNVLGQFDHSEVDLVQVI